MDLHFNEQDMAFRDEVCRFLDENLTDRLRDKTMLSSTVFVDKGIALEWQALLAEQNWAAPLWPKEYGGCEWTPTQYYIFNRESARAGAPTTIPLGLRMLAPILIEFGSDEQKKRYLPKILSGEHYWCQGFSEPGAGSDLASLQCRAERDGDDYVVNGSKIWTTHAHFADHIFCLVRTEVMPKPQQGISFLLIDMEIDGVTVQPIRSMAGDAEVNAVFFQDVRVSGDCLVGDEGQGWAIAKYLLQFERGAVEAPRLQYCVHRLRRLVRKLLDSCGDAETFSRWRTRMAEVEIDILALEMVELQVLAKLTNNEQPGPESSLMKISASQIEQRIYETTVDAIGHYGLHFEGDVSDRESAGVEEMLLSVMPSHLNARATSIFGGTSEVQKNIIAKSVLGV